MKGKARVRAAWWIPLLAGVATQAPAQQAPDTTAQELLRQQERERVLREQQEARPDVRLERSPAEGVERLPTDESPCFRIERIVLDGAQAERFRWALKAADPPQDPATGRCLGTEGINLVMKRMQNAVIARGYVTTRVLAAPQDLNGTMRQLLVLGLSLCARFRARSQNSRPIESFEFMHSIGTIGHRRPRRSYSVAARSESNCESDRNANR